MAFKFDFQHTDTQAMHYDEYGSQSARNFEVKDMDYN